MFSHLKRHIVQAVVALGLFFPRSLNARWFCTPVMHCHGCALSHFACPIGVLLHYPGQYLVVPFVLLGTIMVLGGLFGRFLCGWVCPIGFLQDMLYKIPVPKFRIPSWMGYGKYAALILLVIVVPAVAVTGYLSSWTYCLSFCPTAGLEVVIPKIIGGVQQYSMAWLPMPLVYKADMFNLAATIKIYITVGFLVLFLFSSRIFCKTFCPIGGMMAIFNYVSLGKVKLPPKCISCGKCSKECPVDCQPMQRIEKNISPSRRGECVLCNKCHVICPMVKQQKTQKG